MSTRTITVYKCDACQQEKQLPEYSYGSNAGFTIIKFEGATTHVGKRRVELGSYHACSTKCIADVLQRLAKRLDAIDEDEPKKAPA